MVWLVVLGFWGAPLRVVTNVVNRRCFSCGFLIRCYKRRQSEGFFAENQGFWTQIDDVCNMSTRKGGSNCSGLTTFVTSAAHWSPGQAPPPPAGAQCGPVGQGARLSETGVAFGCWYLYGVETVVAFAGAGRVTTETGIAFAGEKKVFFVHFLVAVVLPVSMVAVWGRAVVPAVSCWPASVAAEASLVSKLARGRVLCAKKFALRGLMCACARKSSPCTLKTPQNRHFYACWANFFAEERLEGLRWASFFAETPLDGRCWANFFAETRLEGLCRASFFANQQSCDPVG